LHAPRNESDRGLDRDGLFLRVDGGAVVLAA
jgi:hypothetical protein